MSRQFIEQSGQQLEQLAEHHVICAVGVDSEGQKHVLGLREGASENAATATSLLEDLVERGLDSGRRYLFVIDGSRALRCAIDKVFGKGSPVQRCRRHKIRNVCDRLPDDRLRNYFFVISFRDWILHLLPMGQVQILPARQPLLMNLFQNGRDESHR